MTINSRNKGATFERDIARELELLTGVSFKRNLEQSRAVDHCDLIPDDPAFPFSLELKRYAAGTGCKAAWKEQSARAACNAGKTPAVIFKFDRQDVRVAIPLCSVMGSDGWWFGREGPWVEMPLDAFACVASEIMAAQAPAVPL